MNSLELNPEEVRRIKVSVAICPRWLHCVTLITWSAVAQNKCFCNVFVCIKIGSFRLDYEYEIEYEYEF